MDGTNIGPDFPPIPNPSVAKVPCPGAEQIEHLFVLFSVFIKDKKSLRTYFKPHKNHILGDGWNKYWSLFPPIPILGVAKVPCHGAEQIEQKHVFNISLLFCKEG